MLVLTRKEGETVVCGDMLITVERAGRGQVKLSFQGPRGTPVLRGELMELPRMGSGTDLPDLCSAIA
jgi:carbon storage regulator CsrA